MARKKSEMKKSGMLDSSKPAGGFDSEQTVAQEAQAAANSAHEELKAALAKGNVLFGSRSVLKALKLKSPKIIFIASNCPDAARNDISSGAKISGIRVGNFESSGRQLGVFCGKPFAIASLVVLAEQKKK